MKPGILLYTRSDDSWIGGVYYIKNIAFVLSCNDYIISNYKIYVVANNKYSMIYSNLPKCINIILIKGERKICRIINFAKLVVKNKIKYIYPMNKLHNNIFGVKPIGWITDFQKEKLSEMYPNKKEIDKWRKEINLQIKRRQHIVVSSKDSYDDFFKFFTPEPDKVHILRFVSFIENELKSIDAKSDKEILDKYNLSGKRYACIANQFWKHKNHILAFDAIRELKQEGKINNFRFICTGKLSDKRNPDYIEKIRQYLNDVDMADAIINLGFVGRKEQLVLMKNAEFIIQPSLFEGWGTVLEECKAMDKDVLLSDIPIHREQMNERCKLFNPMEKNDLKELIMKEMEIIHKDDPQKGIDDMYRKAKQYSIGFEEILRQCSREVRR